MSAPTSLEQRQAAEAVALMEARGFTFEDPAGYAASYARQEADQAYVLGCPDYATAVPFVVALEACRAMCENNREAAAGLLRLAVERLEVAEA